MNMKNFIPSLAAIIVFAAGCANYAQVDQAKKQYSEIKNDPEVVAQAPEILKEVENQFDTIDKLKKNGASKELINHHAYIAEQKVALAREKAELNAVQDEMASIEDEHQRMLAQLQEAEARAAERRAEKARLEAEEAQRRSQELANKIRDLQAQETERGIVLTLNNVLFDFGKTSLKPGSEVTLRKVARFMIEYPERRVMVEGFTDNVGSENVNEKLSLRRAESVKQALVDIGVSPDRIMTRGYGEAYAVANNNTVAGRQQNRRVEIVISDEYGAMTERRQVP
jgi:outer membrane protein OmpA-like peptidoglycan-associated protein